MSFFSRTRFLKKFPPIAKGPGPGPGPAGLTRGPGPGLAQRSPIVAPDYKGFIRLLRFHQMTRVSSDDWGFMRYKTNTLNIRQISGIQDIYPMTRHLFNDKTCIL